MNAFDPHLDVLPPAQRGLLPELAALPPGFVLYGDTALALRLGHRASADFDLLTSDPLDRRALDGLELLAGSEVLLEEKNALTVSLGRQGTPIKIALLGAVGHGRVGEPELAGKIFPVASLIDLGATKLKVLQQRVQARDYLDVAALLRAGLILADLLGAARALYGPAFNALSAKKALAWFESSELSSVGAETRDLLTKAALEDADLPPTVRRSDRVD